MKVSGYSIHLVHYDISRWNLVMFVLCWQLTLWVWLIREVRIRWFDLWVWLIRQQVRSSNEVALGPVLYKQWLDTEELYLVTGDQGWMIRLPEYPVVQCTTETCRTVWYDTMIRENSMRSWYGTDGWSGWWYGRVVRNDDWLIPWAAAWERDSSADAANRGYGIIVPVIAHATP